MDFKRDLDEFFKQFSIENFEERIEKVINEIEKATNNERTNGNWKLNKIEKPGIKGYILRGSFNSNQPFGINDPFNPEPINPIQPRPIPRRPARITKNNSNDIREPLTDLFEEEKELKIYMELPGEQKENIMLNVSKDEIEVKGKRFHKKTKLTVSNLDLENASSKLKNGVLEIVIPKKKIRKKVKKIKID